MALKILSKPPVQAPLPYAELMHPALVELQAFPGSKGWKLTTQESEQWESYVHYLNNAKTAPTTLRISNPSRKWELVSAFQKVIRRADTPMAMRLLSAMINCPDEWAYWSKRLQVIAAEDIGPGSRILTIFTAVALMICIPSKGTQILAQVFTGLTELLIANRRSRAYCSMSIIEGNFKYLRPTFRLDLPAVERWWLEEVVFHKPEVDALEEWCTKSNWRGDGMLKFAGMSSLVWPCNQLQSFPEQDLTSVSLFGLPDYAYDGHTRTGQQTLGTLCYDQDLKNLLKDLDNPKVSVMGGTKKLLGWAMFYQEGCLIKGQLHDPVLTDLEQQVIADAHGLPFDLWQQLNGMLSDKLKSGRVNDVRSHVLRKTYGPAL
jgi:hypothetical protein